MDRQAAFDAVYKVINAEPATDEPPSCRPPVRRLGLKWWQRGAR